MLTYRNWKKVLRIFEGDSKAVKRIKELARRVKYAGFTFKVQPFL